jgi:miniconductance mechanosensitive channel
MTFLIRQLPPGPNGLPIEIYVFTNDTAWGSYESIQADIFDHIFAVVPAFDLSVFQNPTGQDFGKIGKGFAGKAGEQKPEKSNRLT